MRRCSFARYSRVGASVIGVAAGASAAAQKRKLALILPRNDLSVNVEMTDSFNKRSTTSFSIPQSRGIIFNLRSNLLTSRSHFPSARRLDHAFVADNISSAPGL
jgi:hypothetical protein